MLDYSAPQAFFTGAYRYRSPLALVVAVGFLASAAVAAYLAVRQFPLIPIYGRIVAGIFSTFCFAGGGYLFYLWCARRELELRIPEEGIEYSGKVWGWPRVTRIGGEYANGGVIFFIKTRDLIPGHHTMPTTPALTDQHFRETILRIYTFLRDRYPNVSVEMKPRTVDSF